MTRGTFVLMQSDIGGHLERKIKREREREGGREKEECAFMIVSPNLVFSS